MKVRRLEIVCHVADDDDTNPEEVAATVLDILENSPAWQRLGVLHTFVDPVDQKGPPT